MEHDCLRSRTACGHVRRCSSPRPAARVRARPRGCWRGRAAWRTSLLVEVCVLSGPSQAPLGEHGMSNKVRLYIVHPIAACPSHTLSSMLGARLLDGPRSGRSTPSCKHKSTPFRPRPPLDTFRVHANATRPLDHTDDRRKARSL